MFPQMRSALFLFAATIVITSSGRLVAMATIVAPMNISLAPIMRAPETAPSSADFPPIINKIKPPINKKIALDNEQLLFVSSFSSLLLELLCFIMTCQKNNIKNLSNCSLKKKKKKKNLEEGLSLIISFFVFPFVFSQSTETNY